MDERINRVRCVHTMESRSAFKGMGLELMGITRMNHEDFMPGDVSHIQGDK